MPDAIAARCVALLKDVLALPYDERARWIERECAGDAALRERLLRLLELDATDDELLDAPLEVVANHVLAAPDDEAAEASRAGERIGPWRLVHKLGEGGMGAVWLAERADGGFTQRVALKLIKLGMDSAAVQAQFRRERAVLAHLQHPHIACLIDGGVDAHGRPWFAMERVEGIGLREWLQRNPPLRARLELFLKLCRAVAYAHARLVVHRDLKPANVMVQADDEPRLLDFGIAKLLEADVGEETATANRFLTRAYAAPEQLRGEPVSTATDVFALGVLLFELLTGIHGAAVRGQAAGVPRPSAVVRQRSSANAVPTAALRGDLDAIVQRATAEDLARRYGTVQAFGDDIERHLHGRAVVARPDGILYRFGKLVRRNRLASTAFALALLAVVAGAVVSQWHAHQAGREAARAIAVKRFLVELFDDSRNTVHGMESRERTVAALLADGAARLRSGLGDQPELRDELYEMLVEIFDSTGDGERSIPLARERLAAAEAAWGADDPRVAPALVMLAGVLINHEQANDAGPLLARAQRLLDRAGAHGTLEQARLWAWEGMRRMSVEDAPRFDGTPLVLAVDLLRRKYRDRDELFVALFQLAQVAGAAERYDVAEDALTELRQWAIERHGDDSLYVAHADLGHARLLLRTGRYDEALARATVAVAGLLRFEGEQHQDTFAGQLVRIKALVALGRHEEAHAAWREADTVRERMQPDNAALREAFAELRRQFDAR